MAQNLGRIIISGFTTCPFYRKAVDTARTAYSGKLNFEALALPRNEFHQHRVKVLEQLGKPESSHTTCPLVYTVDNSQVPQKYIGGSSEFIQLISRG